ncbi:hypothetical protein H633G_03762 [Metarhizium anisopliae BRIP 53284]|nr:hypothetical protein H633G_03762 [Metarhizium anisopliae BRIP 53284]
MYASSDPKPHAQQTVWLADTSTALTTAVPVAKRQKSLANEKGSIEAAPDKQRKRKWSPKAKTGCTTCRKRRVKCDELKPSCRVCVSGGRKCEWYLRPVQLPELPISLLASQPSHTVSPPGIQPSEPERYMFDLLRKRTVKHVSGIFEQSFWSVNMLRAAQVYPAVWHACLSFAAVHKITTAFQSDAFSDQSKSTYAFALKQYNSSIRYLLRMMPHATPTLEDQEMVLLVCLLFTGLSSLQRDTSQAVAHSSNGIQLFYRWRYWDQASPSGQRANCILPSGAVVSLITHMEASFRNRALTVSPWRGMHIHQGCLGTNLPTKAFDSAEEAFSDLAPMLTGIVEIMQHIGLESEETQPHPSRDGRSLFRPRFAAWRAKFDLLHQSGKLQPSDSGIMLLLKAVSIGVDVFLQVDFNNLEASFDKFHSSFECLIALMEELFTEDAKRCGDQASNFSELSFSLSACGLLTLVATNCRDGKLRRQAIALLRRFPRCGTTWDPRVSIRVAETIMELEEQGCHPGNEDMNCACIPGDVICADHRVALWSVELLTYQDARILMRTVQDVREGRRERAVKVWIPG